MALPPFITEEEEKRLENQIIKRGEANFNST
jgi:hypothetical protein